MAVASQHILTLLAINLYTGQLVAIGHRQCERVASLQLCILSGQFGEVTEYSLVDVQCRTFDKCAVCQIELGLAALSGHRYGNGNLLTVCADFKLVVVVGSFAECHALDEVKVLTGNLKGRTSTGRIHIVTCDGWLHQREGNLNAHAVGHYQEQIAVDSNVGHRLDNNLVV